LEIIADLDISFGTAYVHEFIPRHIKMQRSDSPAWEEFPWQSSGPISLCLLPQLSSVAYSPLTIFSTSLCFHGGGCSIYPLGKEDM
jgi:hypothetical protein